MAITHVSWDGGGYDIHLLKGEKSQPLNGKLRFRRTTGSQVTDLKGNDTLPPEVTVQFLGLFKGAPQNHGVTVSSNGQVIVAGTLPARRLHNFLVRAVVSDTAGGKPLATHLRIHIHDSIENIWLTPRTLTVYQGSKQRFTVLAEFSDKTVGDITDRNSTVVIDNTPINELRFGRNPQGTNAINVDGTGDITVVQQNAQQEVLVSIQVKATQGTVVLGSTAKVNTKPFLAQPRTITRVRGVGSVDFSNKVNILFVPDGFQDSEKQLFNQIVDRIADTLQVNPATFPYNELKESINYWRLEDPHFVPSVEQNVTVLGEMDLIGRRNPKGTLIPFPLKPLPTAPKWTLANMLHMIGLPVPDDANKSLVQKEGDWKVLYDDFDRAKIDAQVFGQWRDMADRTIVNERDTAFGIAVNDRPRADEDPDRYVLFQERRTRLNEFLLFVDKLQLGSTVVGTTWTSGKDKGLICIVARSARHAGNELKTFFAHSLGSSLEDQLQPSAGGRGIDLVPMKLTKANGTLVTLNAALVPKIAHECAHALGLSDEYGGEFEFPITSRLDLSGVGNLQPASEIVFPQTASIDAENIRWNLPRIKAAGVLAGAPTPSGANFTVKLVAMRSGDFAKDDIVRLRKREFLTDSHLLSTRLRIFAIDQDTVTFVPPQGTTIDPAEFPAGSQLTAANTGASGTLESEPAPSVHGGTALDVSLRTGHAGHFNVDDFVRLRKSPFSGRFKVAAAPVGNQLTLTPIEGTKLKPADYPAGHLLIATVPASGNPVGKDLSLIAPLIRGHIASTDSPLNAPKLSPKRPCVAKKRTDVVTPTNLPSELPKGRPANKAHLVGLYEGGGGFDCGIFHPTGLCMMNDSQSKRSDRFCQVCRYLLIDRVDPTRHKELENIYKTEYPEP